MSQVQFSGFCSQDSGPQGRKSQVLGTQFQGPGCQGPSSRVLGVRVLCLRVLKPHVPDSRVPRPGYRISGSQGLESQCPWVPDLRVPGLRVSGSQISESQVPRIPGLRVSGSRVSGSLVLILDYACNFLRRFNSRFVALDLVRFQSSDKKKQQIRKTLYS